MCEVDDPAVDTLKVLDASILASFGLKKPEPDNPDVHHP